MAKPVYIEMPGWKTSTIGTDAFDNFILMLAVFAIFRVK
jgi:adenylosuccinate synthase